jgi:hypothetical protein
MATRKRKKVVREADIENAFVRKIKELGCRTRKLNGMGFNSWPDRLILCPGGAVVFIEFKKPGEDLRPAQQQLHEDVGSIGHTWYTCDNVDDAMEIVHNAMIAHINE